jgi:hypothetical protein
MTARSYPIPFEGETLFSVVARVYLRSAFKSAHNALLGLGLRNCRHLASPLGGRFLSRMLHAFPGLGRVLTPENAVWQHTTSPLLLAFSKGCNDPEKRCAFTEAVGARGGWGGAPRTSMLLCPKGLRFCIECYEQDVRDSGVAYWHREHQVRMVTRCWRHGTRLKEILPKVRQGYELDVPTPEIYGDVVSDVLIPDPQNRELGIRIAVTVAKVLHASHWAQPEQIRQLFLGAADGSGLLHHGRPSRKRIWDLMEGAYGVSFLAAMGLPTRYTDGVVKRYILPFKVGNIRLDAVIIILMAVALGLECESLCEPASLCTKSDPEDERDSGNDAGGCLVNDVALERALASNGFNIGRTVTALKTSRGQLIRRIIQAGIICPIVQGRNAKFSESDIRRMMNMMRTGVPRERILEEFSCASSFLDVLPIYDPLLREDAKRVRYEKTKMENRDDVSRFIAETAGVTRAALWNDLPGPMSFLQRHDREWLRSVLDRLPKQMSKTQAPTAGRGRIDDCEFDRMTLEKLESIREQLTTIVPPCRVTATLAVRLAGLSLRVFSRLAEDRLPRTHAFLQEVAETEEQYVRRKLKYALSQLATSRHTVTATDLRLASGFPPAKLKQYQEYIRQVAEEAGMPLNSRSTIWTL